MDFPVGTLFFHYTTCRAAFEHILPTQMLRMSPYTQMHDPLENKPWQFHGSFFVTKDGEHARVSEQALIEFDRGARTIWDSAKLLALTVDATKGYGGNAQPFGRGWSRARMWEQYAEGHAGACLLFDQAELREAIVRSLHEHGLPPPYYKPIRYTAAGPAGRLLNLDLADLAGQVTPQLVADFVEEHNDELFFLKTRDWESEQEYRFVVTAPDDDFVFVDYGSALKAVIVGERLPRWQRAGAIQGSNAAGAEALRLSWASGVPRPVRLVADDDPSQDSRREILARRIREPAPQQ